MRRLIYTSRSCVTHDPSQLENILRVSVAHNREVGITGMLWTDGLNFAQVLEGDAQAIEKTMKRISLDPRHSQIVVVLDREVMCRQFGEWAMVQAGDSIEELQSTTFLLGFALSEHTTAASHLYAVVRAAEEQMS